jgi:predicted DsbA family dithiol-disulfide isomerase
MSLPIDVWSDFVCPWCYLVSTSLEALKQSHRIALHWRAYELRPEGSPPMPQAYRERIEAARPRLYAIARESYGLEIHQGPFGINTRSALTGMKFAESQGRGDPYHKAVFEAYWLKAQSIDNRQVLAEIAGKVGLNTEAFLTALDDDTYKTAVLNDEEQASMRGLSGVPAMVFMGKYLVKGAQPYDVLQDIVEKLEAGAVG